METFNRTVFILINATPNSTQWLLNFALFAAKDLIFIVPTLSIVLWLWGRKNRIEQQRTLILKTNVALIYAFLIATCVSHILPYPRPFAVNYGSQFLQHTANAAYPSDHATIIFTFALAFFCWHRVWSGLCLFVMACAIAWARVYVGVHWPLDMLGGLLISALACLAAQLTWQFFGEKLSPYLIRLYRILFTSAIRKGWVRF